MRQTVAVGVIKAVEKKEGGGKVRFDFKTLTPLLFTAADGSVAGCLLSAVGCLFLGTLEIGFLTMWRPPGTGPAAPHSWWPVGCLLAGISPDWHGHRVQIEAPGVWVIQTCSLPLQVTKAAAKAGKK